MVNDNQKAKFYFSPFVWFFLLVLYIVSISSNVIPLVSGMKKKLIRPTVVKVECMNWPSGGTLCLKLCFVYFLDPAHNFKVITIQLGQDIHKINWFSVMKFWYKSLTYLLSKHMHTLEKLHELQKVAAM